jgi:hypothetical protein
LAGRFSLSLSFVTVPFVPFVRLLNVFTKIPKPRSGNFTADYHSKK